MVATGVPCGARMNVSCKSALSTFGCSNVGGHFAPELKKAGYDHIIIKGKAEKPVWLWIDDDKVEIRSAVHLWGKDVPETDRLLKEELQDPDIRVGAIGRAGENLVRFACIMFCLSHAAGQTGTGSIMGSKNLKAIAVRGSGDIKLADKKLVRQLSSDLVKRMKKEVFFSVWRQYGTLPSIELYNPLGMTVKNLTMTGPIDLGDIHYENLAKYFTGPAKGCHACPIGHLYPWEIKEGPYAGEKGVGVEIAPQVAFGPLMGISYAPAVYKGLSLSNRYGMDLMELAFVISAAMEWFEKGIVTKKDLDGIELKFGDHLAMTEMIHRIAGRQGIGDIFAEGVVHAAEKIGKGAEECISSCKGAGDMIYLDYRLWKGAALNQATSNVAAHPEDGIPITEYGLGFDTDTILRKFGSLDHMNPLSYNKASSVVYWQDFNLLVDLMQTCKFLEWNIHQIHGWKGIAEIFQAVTGMEMGEEDLLKAANRVWDLERAFWVREGFGRKDDCFHGKINKPSPSETNKGEMLNEVEWNKMLDEYYQLRGWDIRTGIPTKEKLLRNGLADIAEDLEKRGKL
jgi:aldehyde:ferredoxin oxidoreductase